MKIKIKNYGFTLAEVLITLGIIGVVAVMTLSVLINKIKDNQYLKAMEKVRLTVGEAGRLLAVQGDISSASNTEDFVKNYLSKQLKIIKYCGTNVQECGFSEKIKKLGSDELIAMPTTQGELDGRGSNYALYSFLTANGYSVSIYYINYCQTEDKSNSYYFNLLPCMIGIYDMNGKKGPNKFGKDIGYLAVYYPDESSKIVSTFIADNDAAWGGWINANKACTGEYTLPTMEELNAISRIRNLTNLRFEGEYSYWSSTSISQNKAYSVSSNSYIYRSPISNTKWARCVKR